LHGWTINGFLGPNIGQQAIAQQFTPMGNYTFSDAQVAVVLFSGPNSIDVFLQADSNGLPGAVIEEIPISGLGSTPAILAANSALFPVLQDGTPYWLTLVAGAAGVVAGWNWNSIGDSSVTTFASTQGGSPAGPWAHNPAATTRSAFEIDGTAVVSEPSSLVLLLGCVLATLGWRVRCRRYL
jgi:hypothetical protein